MIPYQAIDGHKIDPVFSQTGGLTLTLGLTYLALVAHERNRQAQADILRAQTRVVNTLARDPMAPKRRLTPEDADALYPPLRAELEARRRSHFVETAKDRWNAEIEGAVRWAQNADWTGVRENAETRLLGLAKAVDAAEVKEQVKTRVQETGKRAAGVAAEVRQDVKAAVDKGREMVGKAKAAVYLAEERADAKADAKLLHLSEIEKVLNQRYEKNDDIMKKSIKEVLAERYKPIGERDNTRLRGI